MDNTGRVMAKRIRRAVGMYKYKQAMSVAHEQCRDRMMYYAAQQFNDMPSTQAKLEKAFKNDMKSYKLSIRRFGVNMNYYD